jgi:hypothetical protein
MMGNKNIQKAAMKDKGSRMKRKEGRLWNRDA